MRKIQASGAGSYFGGARAWGCALPAEAAGSLYVASERVLNITLQIDQFLACTLASVVAFVVLMLHAGCEDMAMCCGCCISYVVSVDVA